MEGAGGTHWTVGLWRFRPETKGGGGGGDFYFAFAQSTFKQIWDGSGELGGRVKGGQAEGTNVHIKRSVRMKGGREEKEKGGLINGPFSPLPPLFAPILFLSFLLFPLLV